MDCDVMPEVLLKTYRSSPNPNCFFSKSFYFNGFDSLRIAGTPQVHRLIGLLGPAFCLACPYSSDK